MSKQIVAYLYGGLLCTNKKKHTTDTYNVHEFLRFCNIALLCNVRKMKINIMDRKKISVFLR